MAVIIMRACEQIGVNQLSDSEDFAIFADADRRERWLVSAMIQKRFDGMSYSDMNTKQPLSVWRSIHS